MSGYTGVAHKILHELNFYDYDTPYTPTEQPHSTTKYEYNDIGGGEEMVNLANPAGSVNILVKYSA